VHLGRETSMHYFSCSRGTSRDSTKIKLGHIMSNYYFASVGIRGSCGALWCVWGTNHRCTSFFARVGSVQILEKAHRDTLRQTCIFIPGGICGSRSALRCIWGEKRRCTIFHACVGPVVIPQKAHQDRLRQTFVLRPVGSVGDVVHCCLSVV
jgi:hypothetical protein